MNVDEKIAGLLDRYFEGVTTLEEEGVLRDYFRQENISEEFRVYQPIFQYFASCHCGIAGQAPKDRRQRRRAVFAIAASLLLLITLRFAWDVPEVSLAYIDGLKQTDIVVIQAEALRSLENFSAENDAVYSSQIDALNLFLDDN
ncbi:hypothetical protein SAMD00024442_35_5 [Candidatus Symbiothrix dinenymphae]|nr:hypothetical protein SAMD00024442_35_5 [Candidatus Symbiothrix dinenymphae]